MRSIVTVIIGFFLLAGCKEAPSQAEETFRKNLKVVLDGHDELMKEQATVFHLLDSINKQIKATEDTTDLKAAGAHLQVAIDDMYDWMGTLTKDFGDFHGNEEKGIPDEVYEEKIEKLKIHEKRLSDLEKQFDQGISEAKSALIKAD